MTKVEKGLKKAENGVFMFYGHGLSDQMLGQNDFSVIDLENVNLLADRVVYAVACWTAQTLGKEAAKFARCYLGYKDRIFIWLEKPYAKHMERCVNKGIKSMTAVPGCTVEKARQHILDEYDYWIGYYTIGDGASGFLSTGFAADLRHNRDALSEVFGDKTASIYSDYYSQNLVLFGTKIAFRKTSPILRFFTGKIANSVKFLSKCKNNAKQNQILIII